MTHDAPLPKARDLSHHLSLHARSRYPSPYKDIVQYMGIKGMISLAGGLPHPSLFPFHNIDVSAYPSTAAIDPEHAAPPAESVSYTIGRQATDTCQYGLDQALQYSVGSGMPALREFIIELNKKLWKPAYEDWEILVNLGASDAWNKVLNLLLERGDWILVESKIYATSQAVFIPMGVRAVPIDGDGEGISPERLAETLENWDDAKGRRPHVIYLVPVGQNPLGTTSGYARRKAIYDVCVKYDVIIIEDDPYAMLQYDAYTLGEPSKPASPQTDVEGFLASMSPSFLTMDYEGRVIRLDSFSKILIPGSRLGWYTASARFIERLLRAQEVEAQAPSGLSQAIVGQLLATWGMDGFLTWLTNLREQYRVRRDWMIDAFADTFDLVAAPDSGVEGVEGIVGFAKGHAPGAKHIISFIPPVGGMFLWLSVNYKTHPDWAAFKKGKENPEREFEEILWKKLIADKVLLTPGWYQEPYLGPGIQPARPEGDGYFRIAYSYESKESQDEGIRRLAEVLQREWAQAS